jgi:hypothetical protein
MENTPENFYKSLYIKCGETSKMFGIIPIFFTEKKSSGLFYLFLILAASMIEANFQTYFIWYIITFLLIAEHRRIVLVRETVLDMCITEEVIYDMERKDNKDFLDECGMNYDLTDRDRCDFFYERLNYVDCINPYIYIKRHYVFLLTVVALLVYFTVLVF